MGFAGFGKTELRFDMFELIRSIDEAKRLKKCQNIYHRGQDTAWDGREVLASLVEKHGGVHLPPRKAQALKRIFAIILWGELAAWKISAQLADGLVPMEAKMAATSQAFDEARHFYVMHDYLKELGYEVESIGHAPRALLDTVLETPNLAHKLLGMQLLIEPLALTIFQTVRETEVEPVITELMKYYERDEARHVGLGMQYLPSFIAKMSKREVAQMITFQARTLVWALWELKVLEPDFNELGIDPRVIMDRGRKKQLAALGECFRSLGRDWQRDKNYAAAALNAACEMLFPTEHTKPSRRLRMKAAWSVFWGRDDDEDTSVFNVHSSHTIHTQHGVSHGETIDGKPLAPLPMDLPPNVASLKVS